MAEQKNDLFEFFNNAFTKDFIISDDESNLGTKSYLLRQRLAIGIPDIMSEYLNHIGITDINLSYACSGICGQFGRKPNWFFTPGKTKSDTIKDKYKEISKSLSKEDKEFFELGSSDLEILFTEYEK